MSGSVFERIQERLERKGVAHTVLRHEPVFTSAQAAVVRRTALASGAKALVVKAGEAFRLLVIPADRKLDSRKARAALDVKGLRFASHEEVERLTGLPPGAIPPFGSLFNLPTVCDPALGINVAINFNAGDRAVSVQMSFEDYREIENPLMADLTEAKAGDERGEKARCV